MSDESKLLLHPLRLNEAMRFVANYHRHHKPPQGGLFAIGCAVDGSETPCGVVIVGRPVSRHLDDGWTVEVTRCCTNGHKNACSMLYGAAWRAAKAMGYKKMITYTLMDEGGASLRASGAKLIGEAGGGTWNRKSRPRVDLHPLQMKFKWEFT